MHRRACAAFLALGLAALASPAAADEDISPFAGRYSGAYTFKSTNPLFPNLQRGKLTLAIAASGKVTGTAENLSLGRKATIKGTVDEDGALEVSVEFSDQTYTLKGTVTKTKRGRLKGTLSQYFGRDKPVGTLELDLPRK